MVLLSLRGVHHSTLFGVVPLWCPSHITRKKTQALLYLVMIPLRSRKQNFNFSLTLVGETPCKAEEAVFLVKEVIGPRGIPTVQVTLLVEDIQQ